jgi:hypothetical protein
MRWLRMAFAKGSIPALCNNSAAVRTESSASLSRKPQWQKLRCASAGVLRVTFYQLFRHALHGGDLFIPPSKEIVKIGSST